METTTRQSAQVSPQIATPFSDHPFLWGAVRRYYAVVDSLGVIRAVCDRVGNAATFSYGLYGDVRSVSDLTPDSIASKSSLRYKSYPFEAELGLYLLGGRLYHPLLGRFLAPDSPGFTSIGEPSGLNPYCYCRNDPVTYTDHTGHMAVWAIGLIAGAIIGTVIGGTYGGLTAASQGKTGWEVVGAIGIGALAGGIMGAGAGFGSAVLTGALAEVAGIAAWSAASWGIALGASAGTGMLGGFTMDTLSQIMYYGGVTDWASVGWSSLQGGIINIVSMLSTSVGGGAGASWAANLGMNVVMGFPVSGVSFAIDMFRYYVWIPEEEKERRRRRKAALAWS